MKNGKFDIRPGDKGRVSTIREDNVELWLGTLYSLPLSLSRRALDPGTSKWNFNEHQRGIIKSVHTRG